MNQTSQIVNPWAPLIYIPPVQEATLRTALYLEIGVLGAYIWDLFTNIHDDYRRLSILLLQRKITYPACLYFFSRLGVLVSVLVHTALQTVPLGIDACKSFTLASCVLWHVASSSSALLFFLRVRAVYERNKYITAFFLILWLGIVGGSMPLVLLGSVGVIGPTEYCLPGAVRSYFAASPITLLINDTCVFVAISWRLLSTSGIDAEVKSSSSVLRVVFGHNLPKFSRMFFQDGQIYYLTSVVVNVISVIVTTAPGMPFGFVYISALNTMVVSMMASKVYQRTTLTFLRETEISTTFIETEIRRQDPPSHPAAYDRKPIKSNKAGLWNENMWSGILLALILSGLLLIPIVCVLICTGGKSSHTHST